MADSTLRLERTLLTPWASPCETDLAVLAWLRAQLPAERLWPTIYLAWHDQGGEVGQAGDLRLLHAALWANDDVIHALVEDYQAHTVRTEHFAAALDKAIRTGGPFCDAARLAQEVCLGLALDLATLLDVDLEAQELQTQDPDPYSVLPLIAWLDDKIAKLAELPSDRPYFSDQQARDLAGL
jgi:hypothetical protein